MATHEFGLMPTAPKHGQRFDCYEPEAYAPMIAVDDANIEAIAEALTGIPMYAHSLDVPYPGLAYCGITLIPPSAMEPFLEILSEKEGFDALKTLLAVAKEKQQYVIHYGL